MRSVISVLKMMPSTLSGYCTRPSVSPLPALCVNKSSLLSVITPAFSSGKISHSLLQHEADKLHPVGTPAIVNGIVDGGVVEAQFQEMGGHIMDAPPWCW